MCLDISITYYTEYSKRKKKLHLQRKCLSSYLHVSLTCLFLSRLLIKYEIDIHVRYILLTIQLFLSELPISTFYGKQFYQKQVRKRNTIPNLRIAEHIFGRN